jgi:hypothetical protein
LGLHRAIGAPRRHRQAGVTRFAARGRRTASIRRSRAGRNKRQVSDAIRGPQGGRHRIRPITGHAFELGDVAVRSLQAKYAAVLAHMDVANVAALGTAHAATYGTDASAATAPTVGSL